MLAAQANTETMDLSVECVSTSANIPFVMKVVNVETQFTSSISYSDVTIRITKDATINVQTSVHTVKAGGNILSRLTWDIESNCEGPAKHNLRVSGNYNKPAATVFQRTTSYPLELVFKLNGISSHKLSMEGFGLSTKWLITETQKVSLMASCLKCRSKLLSSCDVTVNNGNTIIMV